MPNKNLFSTPRARAVPTPDTVNDAGGAAYALSDKQALAQFAATGCFSNTYYSDAKQQKDRVDALLDKVDPAFVAKCAVYARKRGHMKDMPAYFAQYLALKSPQHFEHIAPRCLDNGKMIRNILQMLRSRGGKHGKGGAIPRPVRRFVERWLNERSPQRLLNDSVGNSPSLRDVILMVHPKPKDAERAALFAYLTGNEKKADPNNLPQIVKDLERFRKEGGEVPAVEHRLLANSKHMTTQHWRELAVKHMGWHALRMSLNMLMSKDVFDDKETRKLVANRLSNEEEIRKSRVFPYQAYAAYRILESDKGVPASILNALQVAVDIACDNIPYIEGNVVICVDKSGSMSSPVTGSVDGVRSSVISCGSVASLIAAAIVRKNPESSIVEFDTDGRFVQFNPRDSVITNMRRIRSDGGGTNCSSAILRVNEKYPKGSEAPRVLWMISDNESWADNTGQRFSGSRSEFMRQWRIYQDNHPGSSLICHDLVPNSTTQAPDESGSVYNVGGFSDAVFDFVATVVARHSAHNTSEKVEQIMLDKQQNPVLDSTQLSKSGRKSVFDWVHQIEAMSLDMG